MQQGINLIRIIYTAIIVTTTTAILASHFFNGIFPTPEIEESILPILLIVSTFSASVMILMAIILPRRKLKSISSLNLGDKLKIYRSYVIVRGALLEGCCIMFSVLYLIFKQQLYFYEAIFVLSILLIYFPSNNRLVLELKVTPKELETLS